MPARETTYLAPNGLASIFPGRRPVRLAGGTYRVAPFRLGDLLRLERRMAADVGDPAELPEPVGAEGASDVPGEATEDGPNPREESLRAAYRESLAYPPTIGTPAADEWLATPTGVVAYLRIVLGRGQFVDEAMILHLAARMTAAEWRRLDRAAWGVPGWRSIARELKLDGRPSGDPANWGEMVDAVARAYGMSYRAVLKLTLPEFDSMLRSGKAEAVPPDGAGAGGVVHHGDPEIYYRINMATGALKPEDVPERFGGTLGAEEETRRRAEYREQIRGSMNPILRAALEAMEAKAGIVHERPAPSDAADWDRPDGRGHVDVPGDPATIAAIEALKKANGEPQGPRPSA